MKLWQVLLLILTFPIWFAMLMFTATLLFTLLYPVFPLIVVGLTIWGVWWFIQVNKKKAE